MLASSRSNWAIADIAARCNAVLLAWYGGGEAGNAIADSISGANNPAGRVSASFPKSIGHFPLQLSAPTRLQWLRLRCLLGQIADLADVSVEVVELGL